MYCGLDFGTSNSLCSIEGMDGRVAFVEVDDQHSDIPSAAFYPLAQLDQPIYGREAIAQYIDGVEGRLLRSFKRLLGTPHFGSGTMLTASKKLKFQDLFVGFIKHLKRAAESHIQAELTHVVFGRPVKFSSQAVANRSGEADLAAVAGLLGFSQVEFQYEPIAAAFAHEQRLSRESLAIVVDIGGGTSDFSMLRLGPDRIGQADRSGDILANAGMAIGGTDFDSLLATSQVMTHLGYKTTYGAKDLAVPNWPYFAASDWNQIVIELYLQKTYLAMKAVVMEAKEPEKLKRFLRLIENRSAHHLLKEVEMAKITLSDHDSALIEPSFIETGLQIPVNRFEFEAQLKRKITALQQTAQEALTDAGIAADQVELVIMTGGASAVPVLQAAFMNLFPQATLSDENRMSSVCEGLLYDARRKFG